VFCNELCSGGCTGASTALPADQCAAWQAFWDGAHGNGDWTGVGASCTRTDPCKSGCGGHGGDYNTCNDAGTTVTNMYVPASPCSLPCAPRHPSRARTCRCSALLHAHPASPARATAATRPCSR
jgi:hypothetical protein